MVFSRETRRRFLTFEQLDAARHAAVQQVDEARQQADEAVRRADDAEQRLARVLDLSRKARHGQASADELAELDRLEGSA